ncbi:hypothetical protein EES44_07930 [Streptomyces sp. ADI96-15]|nr:hypothetical protein EES44_07930 [Streptomyces sp. ADI96-15]
MHQQTIAKLEAGQRSLKLSEADLLAQALNTTVHTMLANDTSSPRGRRRDLRVPGTIQELAARLEEAREQHGAAVEIARQATHAVEQAQARLNEANEESMRAREEYAMAMDQVFGMERWVMELTEQLEAARRLAAAEGDS